MPPTVSSKADRQLCQQRACFLGPRPSLAVRGKTPTLADAARAGNSPPEICGTLAGRGYKGEARLLQVPADLLAKSSFPTLALGLKLMPQTHSPVAPSTNLGSSRAEHTYLTPVGFTPFAGRAGCGGQQPSVA